jgi:acetate kinase
VRQRCGILAVNGGSSSLKARLFEVVEGSPAPRCDFRIDRILDQPRWRIAAESSTLPHPDPPDLEGLSPHERHRRCMGAILEWIDRAGSLPGPAVIGHRVVHGGDLFDRPARIDDAVLSELRRLVPLAPLHQGVNIALIEACRDAAPAVPQVACFDTMFHRHQPRIEREYALPAQLTAAGVHRYGFHGLSYEYVWQQLRTLDPEAAAGRVVIAHLGAGASLCAIREGRSIATTMGFSTLDGLPMGTRCGSLDPGALIFLMREQALGADQLEELLYRRSGLLGVSGSSADMEQLRRSKAPRARFAIDQFAYRIVRETGSLAAALGGLDTLVFTGGIGENDAALRAEVVGGCEWLGARLDPDANARGTGAISAADSATAVRVIPTSEEAMIARHALPFAAGDSPAP